MMNWLKLKEEKAEQEVKIYESTKASTKKI